MIFFSFLFFSPVCGGEMVRWRICDDDLYDVEH